MSTLYRVRNWTKHFENNRSKTVADLRWVPIPNRHDGEGYAMMMEESNSAELFAAWILILQIASRCKTRGTLAREDGSPLTLDVLAMRTRAPRKWFEKAVPFLCKIGWLEALAGDCQAPDTRLSGDCQAGDEERREGMEGNGRGGEEGGDADASNFMESWNALPSPFPKIRAMSKDRRATLRERLREPFWRENWKTALLQAVGQPFLQGQNDRKWIMDAEFFLRPDSVLKIVEGRYLKTYVHSPQSNPVSPHNNNLNREAVSDYRQVRKRVAVGMDANEQGNPGGAGGADVDAQRGDTLPL